MTTRNKRWENLVECISEIGAYIKDNAENLAPNVEHLLSMTIRVNFDPTEYPTINVDYDTVSFDAARAWGRSNGRNEDED